METEAKRETVRNFLKFTFIFYRNLYLVGKIKLNFQKEVNRVKQKLTSYWSF